MLFLSGSTFDLDNLMKQNVIEAVHVVISVQMFMT